MFRRSALLALCALSLVACGGASEDEAPTAIPEPEAVQILGTFLLKQDALPNLGPVGRSPTPAPTCRGRGGYNDIAEGMEVVLSANGTTLDVGRFSAGKVKSVTQFQEQCEFTFLLRVPEGHEFYNVKVGRRGERNYTFAEITSSGALSFTIGP